MATPSTTSRPFIRERQTGPFWYGKWYRNGMPVIRALGPAWAHRQGDAWKPRRGHPPEGVLTESAAGRRMLELMREHNEQATREERSDDERQRDGVTFREVAAGYMGWLADVKDAKPKTLAEHRYMLAVPGTPHRRGRGSSPGLIMGALGDRPARLITTREVEELLRTVAATGVTPRTVNKARQLVCAIFNYGMRPSTHCLPANPVLHADRRAEPEPAVLAFYTPTQIESLASALARGAHRDPMRPALSSEEQAARADEDRQDAEIIRLAAFTGLRRGELVTLRWRDVDFHRRTVTVQRSLSGSEEASSTKSRRARHVPMPDQAKAALERLLTRADFTCPDDYVFVNRFGRRIDPSALRRRYERARDAERLEPLRFHDLRHSYGSLLVAAGVDLVSVKAAMGHSRITTTERYLHARPATALASQFTAAFVA